MCSVQLSSMSSGIVWTAGPAYDTTHGHLHQRKCERRQLLIQLEARLALHAGWHHAWKIGRVDVNSSSHAQCHLGI